MQDTATKSTRPATYADIEALPPDMVGEILSGVLHAHPRPAPRHGEAAFGLGVELGAPFGRGRVGPGGWCFQPEHELHLGAHVIVPDVGGWRRERMPTLPNAAYFEASPDWDWVAEILSPSTQRTDRTGKLAIYAEFGVGHAWYVDPIARTLEVFALTGGKWLLAATFKDDDVVTAPPFDAHTFKLSVLWDTDPSDDQETRS